MSKTPDWTQMPFWSLYKRGKKVGYPTEELLSVYRDHGVIRKSDRDDNWNRPGEDMSAYQLVEPGDLVLNKMKTWQGSLGVSAYRGIVSPAYFVYKPQTNHNSRFMHYALRSDHYIKFYASISKGVRPNQWDLQPEQLDVMSVNLPDLPSQQRIADYLDRETGEIDAMIKKMDELSRQLEVRRDAVWGTEFEAAIEAGSAVRLSLLIDSIADGPFGSSLTSSHYSEDGARVIRLGNLGINAFRDDDKAFIPLAYAEKLSSHTVIPGDVVVAGLGDERMPLGRAAVLPDIGPAIVKADCYRVRPNELVRSSYLAWALSAPQSRDQFKLLSRGTTRARLNTKVVQEVRLPLISAEQQDQLVERQALLTSKIDAMLAKVAALKSLLTERRAALITDVVTGRKEVA
ncbi:hypothetical protein [Microbacterium sp. LWH13-1.2]|uniref:restriction endonuclease subunit S n=1 Tax=Microbacterium sp. LWH13-1.2 TaxID=3135260 RepID=UPI0031386548